MSPRKRVGRTPANLVAVDSQTPGPPVRRRCSGRRRREDQCPDADVAQRLVTEHSGTDPVKPGRIRGLGRQEPVPRDVRTRGFTFTKEVSPCNFSKE